MDPLSILGFLILVIIGIAIILLFVKIIWFLFLPAVVALIVYLLTFDLWWAGVAFLVIVVISALLKIFRK
jgi:hypothetical protein